MIRALLRMHLALQVNEDRLARGDIAFKLVRRSFQRHGFTGQHHGAVLATPHAQRANAKRIAEGQHAMAGDHRNHRVGTLDATMHPAHRLKHIARQQRHAACRLANFMRQHIEQDLGVAVGIDMAVVGAKELRFQGMCIGQVAVVHQHDAKRRIHVKRLRLFLAKGIAGRRVTHLTQPAVARQ